MKTTQEIETFIPTLSRLLHFNGEPKWMALRFMINISLSFDIDVETESEPVFNGKEYRLDQITGEGKEESDHTNMYKSMMEKWDGVDISSKKGLDERLEFHVLRGYTILSKSMNQKTNIFEWMLQEVA